MAKLQLADVKQLSEPIIIEAGILGTEEYRVEKVTTEILEKVNNIVPKDIPKEQIPMDTPVKQLAILLGVEVEKLQGNDMRIIGKVLDFIMKEVTKGIEVKK